MDYLIIIIPNFVIAVLIYAFNGSKPNRNSKPNHRPSEDNDFITDAILRATKSRKSYYNDVYLKSDAWKRKRFVVLRRDGWRCVHCGTRATQVHHKRYAPKNIGKEPIEWLESVCETCHESLHN